VATRSSRTASALPGSVTAAVMSPHLVPLAANCSTAATLVLSMNAGPVRVA
jgi:hypothetical protein